MSPKFDHDKELKKAFDTFAKKMEEIKKLQAQLFADMKETLNEKVVTVSQKSLVVKKKASVRTKASVRPKASSKRSRF